MKKFGVIVREASEKRIKDNIAGTGSFFIVRYDGLSSFDLCSLRMALRAVQGNMFVVKNTIARRTLKSVAGDDVEKMIDGPCGIVSFQEDPVAAAKALFDFYKDHDKLKIKGGFLFNKTVSFDDLEALSKLPGKDALRGQVVMTLKSPIFRLVMVLKGNLRKVVWCLGQIKEKKQQ
jgi:large subunit ribosomal protein L10